MAWVYVLKGGNGRHYIGATRELEERIRQHKAGGVYTTRRLGGSVELVAAAEFPDIKEAMEVERRLKAWKNPSKAIDWLGSR